jgi:hypothetical protein
MQTKHARISFKLLKYIVSYYLNTVATIVTLGVSQPSPLTEILPRDLDGVAALIGTANSHTIPHYDNAKSGW